MPLKNLGENGAWAYPGTAQIYGIPPIISERRKATNFKFGRCIQSVHANKIPLIWEKRERGRIQGLPNFSVPPIISGTGKATNFKFCAHIHRIDRNKSPLKILALLAVGVIRDSTFFRAPYIGRIARSSLRQLSFLVLVGHCLVYIVLICRLKTAHSLT